MTETPGDSEPVDRLPNLGPASVCMLRDVGIRTVGDLRAVGAADAYRRVKFQDPKRVSLNALYALNAALIGLPWRGITPQMKVEWRKAAGLED